MTWNVISKTAVKKIATYDCTLLTLEKKKVKVYEAKFEMVKQIKQNIKPQSNTIFT